MGGCVLLLGNTWLCDRRQEFLVACDCDMRSGREYEPIECEKLIMMHSVT